MFNKSIIWKTAAISSMLIMACGCSKGKEASFELAKKTYNYELGDKVVLDVSKFLKEGTDQEIIDDTTMTSALLTDTSSYEYDEDTKEVISKNRNFLKVGSYEVELSHEDEALTVSIEVEDTTAPKFVNFKDEIKIRQNAEKVKLEDYFKVEDLSEVSIEVDAPDFDVTKPGEYEGTVTAKDEYDNETEKDVTFIVLSNEEADKNGTTESASQEQIQDYSNGLDNGQTGYYDPYAGYTDQTQSAGDQTTTSTTTPQQNANYGLDPSTAGLFSDMESAHAYGSSTIAYEVNNNPNPAYNTYQINTVFVDGVPYYSVDFGLY